MYRNNYRKIYLYGRTSDMTIVEYDSKLSDREMAEQGLSYIAYRLRAIIDEGGVK